jgi:WD40 repeat protein
MFVAGTYHLSTYQCSFSLYELNLRRFLILDPFPLALHSDSTFVDSMKMLEHPYLALHRLRSAHNRNRINHLAFSPTADFLASGGEDGALAIWNVQNGKLIYCHKLQSPVLALAWDYHRPKRVFFGCENGTAAYIDGFQVWMSP